MSYSTPRPAGAGVDPASSIDRLVLDRSADTRTALVFEGRTWSWSEVVGQAGAWAELLRRRRRPGPFHVGVLLENIPEYVFVLFGAALAGATVVGLNPTRRGAELERDIRHTDCQLILSDGPGAGLLEGLDLGEATGRVLMVDGTDHAAELASCSGRGASQPPDRAGAEALYLLLFTSGSTGAPKAVRMTQGRAARTAAESAVAFGPHDVLYCAMPLFHGNALLANLFAGLVSGARIVLRRRFSATGFLLDIQEHACTYFNYVGRALSYIVAVPETPRDSDNRLKWALGSEASPRDILEFTRRFGCPVFEGYGSSENAVVISPAPGMPPGALGRPRAGSDVAVVSPDTGQECAAGVIDAHGRLANPQEAIGEIVGRGAGGRFEGYYNNPEAEAERLRDGWYWTGDLGYRDAEGFFYFAGRTADWLRVDGENFSAASVERVLDRLAGITGVAVYGVPDPVTGDQVMAALEMAEPSAFDPVAVGTFLAGQPDLGTKWAPRFLRVTTALPVTGTGKVDKIGLRAAAWLTQDPVWWRPTRGEGYRPLSEDDARSLHRRFEENDRARLLDLGS